MEKINVKVTKLIATSSNDIIGNLKSIFSHHGIPETVISDNRPQQFPATLQKSTDSPTSRAVRGIHKQMELQN
jgi:hypothetical protein